MKIILACLSLIYVTSAIAAVKTYDVKMQLTLDGEAVFSPRIIVEEGKSSSIESVIDNDGHFVEITPREITIDGKKSIFLKMKIGTIDSKGQRHIISKPEVATDEKNPAQVTVVGVNENIDELHLLVTAERVR